MLAALLLALAGAVAEPPAKEPAAKLELFAKEDWYKEQKGKEEDFVGVLEKVKGGGDFGFGRFNPYRLVMADGDKKTVREVYVGAKTDLLDAYVGKKIKLTGKAVDMEVEGSMHKEIWPARLELVAEKKDDKKEEAKKDAPPAKADILAMHKLYKMEPGQEKEFVGVLMKREKGGYYLSMKDGDKATTEDLILYGDAGDPLAPYIGMKVKVYGKQVAGAVGMRTFQHTLPGRLEVLAADKDEKKEKEEREENEAELRRLIDRLTELASNFERPQMMRRPPRRVVETFVDEKDQPKELKIAATTVWRQAGGGATSQTTVIRTAEEAAIATGVAPEKAKDEVLQKEATEKLAKQFKVEGIDWTKQMVVVATAGRKNTGGYSVEFTGLEVKDKTLTVKWKVNGPKPGQPVTLAITHPAAAALIDRFEGEVKFDPAPPKSEDKDK
jgi:hypothetical protein